MLKQILLPVIVLFPLLSWCQTEPSADSANRAIMNGGDCSDRTFTRVEKVASLKIAKQLYADSIVVYLKSRSAFQEDESITFMLLVDCHAKIQRIQTIKGEVSNERELREAIRKYADVWLPATQNRYIVSSYVKLSIEVDKGKTDIFVFQ
jgi:hypothetical protein